MNATFNCWHYYNKMIMCKRPLSLFSLKWELTVPLKYKFNNFIQTAVNHARQFCLISGQVSLFNPLALKH